jgi:MSHA biogenesis protein MshP
MKCTSAIRLSAPLAERGFSLVTAIFLLVVMAGLGTVMLTVFGTQHTTAALDIQGTRGYQAARAGIEWGTYQAANGSCAASTNVTGLSGTLAPFTVVVTCVSAAHVMNDGSTKHSYRLVATATSTGTVASVDYVERQLQANYFR